jgi:tetratricopeptide (TPR) repeat protein
MALAMRALQCLAGAVILVHTVFPQTLTIYEQAAATIQSGQFAEAIRLLEPRLQEAPRDLKALTLMGMAVSAGGRLEDGNRYYRQALEVNSSFAPALKNLAANEMALGHAADARTHFEGLLRLTPADAAAHLGLAQACIEGGDLSRASQALEGMPAEAPAQAHFAAGELLAKLERYSAAARQFELAQNGYPNPYDAGFNLMLAYVKSGRHADAVRAGEGLVAKGLRKAELYNLLAQAYEGAGKTAEAYGALRTATTIDPVDPANYLDLIALCLTHRNYDLALEIANISISRLPQSGSLHLQRGIVLAMKEDFSAAQTEFEAAVGLDSQRSISHVALALILLQMDQPAEAVTLLRKRTSVDPDYLALWFLGEALNRAGLAEGSPEEKEAVEALSRSVQMNANVPQSRILLAKLLARRGALDQAEQHLTRALELDAGNVNATYQLAQICQKKGDTARAHELFAKVSKAKAEDRDQFTRGGLQHIIRAGSQ